MSDLDRYHALTLDDVEKAICEREPSHYIDHQDWAKDCHSVSLAIVKSDLFESARVARGSCHGVMGQHSWVTLGHPYDVDAPILDCTLWSYAPQHPVVWRGTIASGLHRPHGAMSIFTTGKPSHQGGETIELPGDLSSYARTFLGMLGPLDARGWMQLFNGGMIGWPADEIIAAAYQVRELRPLIPIDIVGMVTDLNPDGLYLKGA